jgi:hypothetical protein
MIENALLTLRKGIGRVEEGVPEVGKGVFGRSYSDQSIEINRVIFRIIRILLMVIHQRQATTYQTIMGSSIIHDDPVDQPTPIWPLLGVP